MMALWGTLVVAERKSRRSLAGNAESKLFFGTDMGIADFRFQIAD